MSILTAFLVSLINSIMPLIMRQFALYERAETKTDMSVALAYKLSILKFLNTSVIYVLVHDDPSSWFSSGDLVYDVFLVLMFAVFASAINFCILLSMICINKV
jgi:hypothetical protein